jgi:aspartyl-tRNA(Asn)/glutamyl-tRNA(Gln) amidotransferase subunit C
MDNRIDINLVKHIALLTRLQIKDEDALAFSNQFSAIIDYFHVLIEVETGDVPPACETANTHNVMRVDEVQPSMMPEDFFENVPRLEGNYVRVPLVFGEE